MKYKITENYTFMIDNENSTMKQSFCKYLADLGMMEGVFIQKDDISEIDVGAFIDSEGILPEC